MAFVGEKFWKWNLKFSKFIKISFAQGHRKHTQNLFNAKFKLDLKHPKYNFFTEIRQQSKTEFLSKKPKIVLNTLNDNFHNFVKIFYNDFRRNLILMMNLRVVWKRKKKCLNRYRRGLETCPRAKTFKSGNAVFSFFSDLLRATSMTQRRVENSRVHFWTFSPVSVKKF